MPPVNQLLQNNDPLRILAYGREKTRKTTWALRAAEAGFHVLHLNLEDGLGVELLKQVQSGRERILSVDVVDNSTESIATLFVTYLLKGSRFIWDEQKKIIQLVAKTAKQENSFVLFDPTKLTANHVIILDTYSALVQSATLEFAKRNNIDLSDADKTDWEGYGWMYNFLSWILAQIQKWSKTYGCHFVVIAHEQVKETRDEKGRIIASRTFPMSSSANHAGLLGRYFSDILYFTASGGYCQIAADNKADRTGGCRNIPPKVFKWEELQFADVCRLASVALPAKDASNEAFVYYAPGTLPEDADKPKKTLASIQRVTQENAVVPHTTNPEAMKVVTPLTKPAGIAGLSFAKKPTP